MSSRRQMSPTAKPTDVAQAPIADVATRRRQVARWLWILFVALGLLGGVRVLRMSSDPDVPLLLRENGAEWIFFDRPFELGARGKTDWAFGFRKSFRVEAVPQTAALTVRAFRDAVIFLDGEALTVARDDQSQWRVPIEVDLAPRLSPGGHELTILVRHLNGPPGVLAYCDALNLRTNDTWEAAATADEWKPVRVADATPVTEQRLRGLTGPSALRIVALPLAALGAVVFALVLWRARATGRARLAGFAPTASTIRWGLLLAWVVLIANNMFKLPEEMGFDRKGHLEYIRMIAVQHHLPLATDGWQAFQAPLYYFIAAAWRAIGEVVLSASGEVRLLRLFSMLCGMAQVEIVYRTLRTILPERQDLQSLGTVVGSLLPMNLYISQSLGNEPMAGAMTAATVGLMLSVAYGSERCRSMKWLALLGGVWGLALLTKATALLLAGPLLVWLIAVGLWRGERWLLIGKWVMCSFGSAAVVSGWYYMRNWLVLGKPFVGGWDPSRGIVWWQDPGFRTLRSILWFGDSLVHPTAAQTMGFWDTMYATFWCDGFLSGSIFHALRPPWNDAFLISGPLLASGLVVLMIAGGIRAVVRRDAPARGAVVLSVALMGVFFAAVLDLYLRLPIYSTAKATYTLGLAPAYSLLFVVGAELLMKRTVGRAIVYALITCWAVAAYLAFFAI